MNKKQLVLPLVTFLFLLGCTCQGLGLPFFRRAQIPTPGVSLATVPAATLNPPTATQATGDPFNIPWMDRSLFQKRLTSADQYVLNSLPEASVYHLSFDISDPLTSVNGIEEVHYTNQSTKDLTEIDFAIYPEILGGTINVNDVQVDGLAVSTAFSTGLLRVLLDKHLQPGKSIVIHDEFSVSVPSNGGNYYFGIFGYNNGILSLAQAYPTILVYNDQGWNNQVPDLNGDPLFSNSSFYLVSIDAPAGLVLAVSGFLVNKQVNAGRQTLLYADGPARDFYFAASTKFSVKSQEFGETTINSYYLAGQDQAGTSALTIAESAIQDFSKRYAAYPYTEFNLVPIITSAGGVEFPGLTSIADNVYADSSFLETVIAHEVAHQWFYNLVGNETQGQPWLDESLAQFATCQYYLDVHGSQAQQTCFADEKSEWDGINDQTIPIGEAVSAYTSNEYVAIVYGRGPLFFDALEKQIGQSPFDSLMQDYTATFAWKVATSDSFDKLAESHCGCDLTTLFHDWVYP